MGTDSRTSKLIARRLVKLPTGTVSFESISDGRLLGKVDCEPKVIGGGGVSADGGSGKKVRLCYVMCVQLQKNLSEGFGGIHLVISKLAKLNFSEN